MTGTTTSDRFPWVGLFTLSLLVFFSVTSEFLPTGLMPDIARELRVTEPQVGLLVTVFAATVVLTAAPLATLTRRYPRKALLILVLLVFVVSNLGAALAPTYGWLMAARILSGVAHGLFWSIVGAYSGHLVPKGSLGRAVAIVSGGGTAAFVLGIPVGTAVGHALGWRLAFAVIAAVLLVLTLITVRTLPAVEHLVPAKTGEIAVPMRRDRSVPGIVIVCVVVLVIMTGQNLFTTYIVPFLIGPTGLDEAAVAGVLFLNGGAGAIGVVLAGLLVDRHPRTALIVSLLGVIASVLVVGLVPGNPWVVLPAMVAWGIAFGGIPSMMQTRMLHAASPRTRDVAAAYLTTAFNVGIGGGALLGGLLFSTLGVTALPFVHVAVTALGLAIVVASDRWLAARQRELA